MASCGWLESFGGNLGELQAAVKPVVQEAGTMLKRAFYLSTQQAFSYKDGDVNDLVTQTDCEIEAFLQAKLAPLLPSAQFIGEESQNNSKNESLRNVNSLVWYVDPIDGTVNFVHRIPYCCVSVGLWFGGQSQLAFIYNPLTEQFYEAAREHGSTLNGQKINVTQDDRPLSQSLLICQHGFKGHSQPSKP